MAQSTVQILLPQTTINTSLIRGDKKPAAAYYLANADLQTLSWSLTAVSAKITLQATLATDPDETTDDDWFDVYDFTVNANTSTGFENIIGNFVWIRAVVEATSVVSPYGVVQYIKASY